LTDIPTVPAETRTIEQLQAGFLEVLPRVEAHARLSFRHVRCSGLRDDRVQEAIAFAWKWFLSAAQHEKDLADYPAALATLATRHVRCGRRLCGQERTRDVLSPAAQRLHGFTAHSLPTSEGGRRDDTVLEALRDNAVTPPPDQAAFRLDFPRWLNSLSDTRRLVALDLMVGEATADVAVKHGLSPGRISQLRRECHAGWLAFCDA
jgi:hypothetical protein